MWAGTSCQGRTGICIFEGTMDAIVFYEIIEKTLLPFIRDKLPTSHRLLQDNDPKHTSKRAVNFFDDNGVNWWRSPPEPPDANPTENMWHELKEYVRKTKPRSKEDLVWTIKAFWRTVTVEKCNKYINHLKKVLPHIVEVKGCVTGY